MKNNEKKNKHMTLDDRIEIQECLSKGMTFKAIGERIGKSQTTISREVKIHMGPYTNSFVRTDEVCPKLLKAPFVCNGCEKKSRSSCPYRRQLYTAKKAQAEYDTVLVESRTGIPLNKESFYETERIISEAVQNGQHIYHIIQSNNLPISTATVYRHIQKRYYSITPMDLPRAVKFKPRNSKESDYVPKWAREGRTFDDFLAFVEDNRDIPLVQLDTVIGKIGGKVIMTIHFVNSDFMIGLLLENKTAAEAASKIQGLKAELNTLGFRFGDIAPLLLTDNGGEFSIVSAFENDTEGNAESNMFFCEPCSPHEKAEIEKNHTLFRDVVKTGTSFDDFSQETVNLIFSHVNAVKRKQFNGKSAYDMFSFYYSELLASALGISFVPANEVIQSPKLLAKFFS
ncbi:MAG: IS30 family transposase [Clostridia bacterium]|nr:IS30 family transposase [Clostridia bacterium]